MTKGPKVIKGISPNSIRGWLLNEIHKKEFQAQQLQQAYDRFFGNE